MNTILRIGATKDGREVTRKVEDGVDTFDRAVALVLGRVALGELDRALADALSLRDAAQRAVHALEKRIAKK
jgi:hypothetical protein